MKDVVVVGASLAGLTAADALRAEGYDGRITVIGDESQVPYTRPPLSKGVLAGTETPESVHIPVPDDIELRAGDPALGLDTHNQTVSLQSGSRLHYDGLVIATGSRARSLASPNQQGERCLRTLDDCLALRDGFAACPRILIVGGGFLGMEIASTCRTLGLEVTVVDREPPLRRVLGGYLSQLIVEAALAAGVRIWVVPEDVELLGDQISGVRFSDGKTLEADLVITAAGETPNTDWLGLTGPIVVDELCRVSPHVVAAGDVAAVRREGDSSFVRTPHWSSAVDQARTAAAALLRGNETPRPNSTPYFWTEGFGLEIKVCGPLPLRGTPAMLEGSIDDRNAVLQWQDNEMPVAAATINHRMPLGRLKRLAASTPPLVRS